MLLHERLTKLSFPLFALFFVLSFGCSGADPKDVLINLSVSDRKIEENKKVIKVDHNDTVKLMIESDEHGSFHIHGYDLDVVVGPDEINELAFIATATGHYPFTLHVNPQNTEHENKEAHDQMEAHGDIFESHSLETGDSFTYIIPQTSPHSAIIFHNHMNHKMRGEIKINASAPERDAEQIEITQNGSFEPSTVLVRAGTAVTWINTGSKRARPTSGEPPTGQQKKDKHHEGMDTGEEVNLGSLEVHPR